MAPIDESHEDFMELICWQFLSTIFEMGFFRWDNQHHQKKHKARYAAEAFSELQCDTSALKVSMRWCVALNDGQIIFSQCTDKSRYSSTPK